MPGKASTKSGPTPQEWLSTDVSYLRNQIQSQLLLVLMEVLHAVKESISIRSIKKVSVTGDLFLGWWAYKTFYPGKSSQGLMVTFDDII